MSQMLNSGGSPQGAGYHSVTQSHTTGTANPTNIQSMTAQSSPLSMSSSQHYGQLSSAQQQHHHHLLQQQQQQQQQLQQKLSPQVKSMSLPQSQSPFHQQQQQMGMTGPAGKPILGSGGASNTYRGLLRRNHPPPSTPSQQQQQQQQQPNPTTTNITSSSGGSGSDGGNSSSSAAMLPVALGGGGEGVSSDNNGGGAVGSEAGVLDVDAGKETTSSTSSQDEKESSNLANTKEKTPMCLINELARFNKVSHQYTLVDEQGPAHKKTFYVKLKLGEEEYSAQGESIKKAQHAAAAQALTDTSFSHPSPKPPRGVEGDASNVTPTVELNALAMKRGEPAVYKLIEPRNQNYSPGNIDFRGMYNQRYHYGRPPRPFYVMLRVGTKEYIGEGPTRQAARHNAATKALKVLRNLPMPSDTPPKPKTEEEQESEDAMKSEISLVHEIALKRNLTVAFEVVRESGPPHMKNFVTKCMVGEVSTEAEGNSKKLSKKRAAEMMLEELRKMPATLPPQVLKPRIKHNNKKKNRNIIKVQKADPSYGVGVNPISRLIQIMQAQKKKEPVYTLLAEKGVPRRREFVMQCQVEEHTSEGVGPNKKLAKRSAAESMLQTLGFSRPSPQPAKPAIKSAQSSEGGGTSDKKVTFVDTGKSGGESGEKSGASMSSTGCQVVPGLLRLNQAGAAHIPGMMTAQPPVHTFTGTKEAVSAVLSKAGPQAEKQARALADFLNIPIEFEDFTKSNSGGEYLTRVTLGTNPVQLYHGTGPSRESSRDAAALSTTQNLLVLATSSLQQQQPSAPLHHHHHHQHHHSNTTSTTTTPNAAGDIGGLKSEIGVTAHPHQLNGAGDQM